MSATVEHVQASSRLRPGRQVWSVVLAGISSESVVLFVISAAVASLVAGMLSRLYKEIANLAMTIQELAQHDETTGAMKVEHARRRLSDEIGRARRYDPVSLILFAVEDAKGDREPLPVEEREASLTKAAQVLRSGLRPHDSAAHYGEREFLIILPHTPLNGALVVESKLRSNVLESTGISLRAGAAEFPEDAAAVDDLLAEATHALEFARQAEVRVASRALFS